MHIVYSACGPEVKEELLVSIRSLHIHAVSGLSRGPAYYHVHVLTDGTAGSATLDDLFFLQPPEHFRFSVHPAYPNATQLFKTCSTERIYLHQHEDFQDLDMVFSCARNCRLWHGPANVDNSLQACGTLHMLRCSMLAQAPGCGHVACRWAMWTWTHSGSTTPSIGGRSSRRWATCPSPSAWLRKPPRLSAGAGTPMVLCSFLPASLMAF